MLFMIQRRKVFVYIQRDRQQTIVFKRIVSYVQCTIIIITGVTLISSFLFNIALNIPFCTNISNVNPYEYINHTFQYFLFSFIHFLCAQQQKRKPVTVRTTTRRMEKFLFKGIFTVQEFFYCHS